MKIAGSCVLKHRLPPKERLRAVDVDLNHCDLGPGRQCVGNSVKGGRPSEANGHAVSFGVGVETRPMPLYKGESSTESEIAI